MESSPTELISYKTIWKEIRKAYNVSFLEALLEIPDLRVFAFGGIVVDLSLGRPWKDLDIRITYDRPYEERNSTVIKILEKYGCIVQMLDLPGSTVFRVKVPSEKQGLIDVTVSNGLENLRIDSKICAIFIDLKTGEPVELYGSSVEDFRNKIIRSIDNQEEELESNPLYLFRALKLAVKTGFTIDPQFEVLLKKKKTLIQKALDDVISYIRGNGKVSMAENFLGSIFGGLKTDAEAYMNLLYSYGFFEEICRYFNSLCGEAGTVIIENNAEKFRGLKSFEDKLSLLLSTVAKAISTHPAACFEEMKKAFALDTARSDGNEFVVDPAKITFVP